MNQESPDADLERMLRGYFAQKKRRPADFEQFWTAVDAALDAKPGVEFQAPLLIEAERCSASGSTAPESFDLIDDDTYAFVLEDTLEESMTEGHDQREQEPSTTARSTRWDTRRRGLGPRGTAVAGIAAALILVIIAATIFAQIAVRRAPHPAATATPSAFTKVTLPNASARLIAQMTTAPDGSLWFADTFTHTAKISHVTPDGAITEFSVPKGDKATDVYLFSIAIGSDGAIWVSGEDSDGLTNTQYIMRMTSDGAFTTIPLPPGLFVVYLVSGSDGALWFQGSKELDSGAPPASSPERVIGRIATDGRITEYPIDTNEGALRGLCIGPDKALWYTAFDSTDPIGTYLTHFKGHITRVSLSGQAQEFAVPYMPNSIASGADGALWYSEIAPSSDEQSAPPPRKGFIGHITTAGVASELPIDPNVGIDQLVAGSDSAIWFTAGQDETGKFGRITPSGGLKTFTTGGNSRIVQIAAASGALWLLDERNVLWHYRLPG
jgi:streptogramin lyase